MKNFNSLFWLTFVIIYLFINSAHAQEAYQTHLSDGHQHFKTSQFNKALAAYQKSYDIEPLDSTLYNIAVSYFKLKNWPQALAHFEKLKRYQGSTDLIEYNLAVTNKKLGLIHKAVTLFETLATSAENDKFALLAEQQLIQVVQPQNFKHKQNKSIIETTDYHWQNMLRLQYGQDNNISLPDDDTVQDEGDSYVDMSLNLTWMSNRDLSNAWMTDFTYFKSKYSESSEYDIDLYALSARKYFTPESYEQYRFWLGLNYDNINLSGNSYISNTSLALGGDYNLSKHKKVSLELSQKYIKEGDAQYRYLAGTANRLKLTWKQFNDDGYWLTGVKHYINDRNDLFIEEINGRRTFTSLTSYSADRTTLFINRSWVLDKWAIGVDLQYRYSEYNDANTNIDHDNNDLPIGTTSLGLREDDRYSLLIDINYNINDDLSVGAEVDFYSNSSTIKDYDYTQSSISVGINWIF